ncbi:MAG: thioredoxin fold domain-containing protein [Bacilli bacterium]|nr:thioredoxin fold domain-containing protein [Bacilli bacterium]
MKKIIFMLLITLTIILTGCGKKITTYDEIDYEKYKKMMENKETFSLVVGSSTCSHCSMFKGTMEKFISNYQINVKYIDISKLSEEDYKLFMSEIGVKSTPTTVFVKDGKQTSVYNRIVGAESYSNVVKAYTKMEYIKG